MTLSNSLLDDLNSRFVWTQDSKIWDSWRCLSNTTGPLIGDCDDYSVTALYLAANKSWIKFWWWVITFQACFWFTRTKNGTPHMMVWKYGLGWIDNTNPKWGERILNKRFPALFPLVAVKLLMGIFK